jgi:uncharacterized protein
MVDFSQKKPQSGLEPWPPLTEIGAKVLGGKPEQSGRIDYGSMATPIIVGVWECTRGKFEIAYPWNEMATILDGSVTITEANGKPITYRAGDTHFAVKGDRATWDITDAKVRKCFFIYTGDQMEKKAAE